MKICGLMGHQRSVISKKSASWIKDFRALRSSGTKSVKVKEGATEAKADVYLFLQVLHCVGQHTSEEEAE